MQPSPSDETTKRFICHECDWTTDRTDSDRESPNRAAIDHYVLTGHRVELAVAEPTDVDRFGSGPETAAARGRTDD